MRRAAAVGFLLATLAIGCTGSGGAPGAADAQQGGSGSVAETGFSASGASSGQTSGQSGAAAQAGASGQGAPDATSGSTLDSSAPDSTWVDQTVGGDSAGPDAEEDSGSAAADGGGSDVVESGPEPPTDASDASDAGSESATDAGPGSTTDAPVDALGQSTCPDAGVAPFSCPSTGAGSSDLATDSCASPPVIVQSGAYSLATIGKAGAATKILPCAPNYPDRRDLYFQLCNSQTRPLTLSLSDGSSGDLYTIGIGTTCGGSDVSCSTVTMGDASSQTVQVASLPPGAYTIVIEGYVDAQATLQVTFGAPPLPPGPPFADCCAAQKYYASFPGQTRVQGTNALYDTFALTESAVVTVCADKELGDSNINPVVGGLFNACDASNISGDIFGGYAGILGPGVYYSEAYFCSPGPPTPDSTPNSCVMNLGYVPPMLETTILPAPSAAPTNTSCVTASSIGTLSDATSSFNIITPSNVTGGNLYYSMTTTQVGLKLWGAGGLCNAGGSVTVYSDCNGGEVGSFQWTTYQGTPLGGQASYPGLPPGTYILEVPSGLITYDVSASQ